MSERIRNHFKSAFGLSAAACDSLVVASRAALTEGLAELSRAVAHSDEQGVSHWAHNLKGNLLNAGIGELAALAAAMEEQAMAGQAGGQGVRDSLEALKAALKDYLGEA